MPSASVHDIDAVRRLLAMPSHELYALAAEHRRKAETLMKLADKALARELGRSVEKER